MPSNKNTPGVKAIRAMRTADRWEHKKVLDRVIDPVWNRREAERARAQAEALMTPPERLLWGGHEVTRDIEPDEVFSPARNAVLNTLENPNMISVEASEQRMQSALEAGVLQAALDASVSAQASNSLETMLCHQLAAAHHAAMALVARASAPGLPTVEHARLLNASARMMQVYQDGLMALQRVRSGGRQTVLVQHVPVSGGGQAVVAGHVGTNPRGRKRRGG